jgi:hypothetical protein
VTDDRSDNLRVRLPKGLTRRLRDMAEAEGVSVNTLLVSLVAGAIHYVPDLPDEEPEEARDDATAESRRLA